VLWAAHQAVANGDSASHVAPVVLSQGNALFKKAQANKPVDTLQTAVRFLSYADSLAPSDPAKFLRGTALFEIGATLDQTAVKEKNCDLAKQVQAAWNQASIDLHSAASFQKEAVAQMLGTIVKYTPTVDKQVKQFCK
jgi:hypothetical protein